jgi:hypothetical protein
MVSHFCDAAVHGKRVRTEVLQMLKPEVTKAKAALAAKIKSFAAALGVSRNSKEIFGD